MASKQIYRLILVPFKPEDHHGKQCCIHWLARISTANLIKYKS